MSKSQPLSPQVYLIWGVALVLLSMLTCLFSVWLALPVESGLAEAGQETATFTPTHTPVPTNTPKLGKPPTVKSSPTTNTSSLSSTPNKATPTGKPQPTSTRKLVETSAAGLENIAGVIKTDSGRLNLRGGPGTQYGRVGSLESGVPVTILSRTKSGDWLEIETENKTTGWASEQYVEYKTRLNDIPVAVNIPPPPPAAEQTTDSGSIANFDVYRGQESGTMQPYTEKWYTFFEGNTPGSILLVFMFDPNVNLNADEVHFYLYDEQYIPNSTIPADANGIPNLGSGSRSARDRDGDLGNGELVWQGGPLQPNRTYYLRLVNGSTSTLNYCLTTQDVYQWICAR